MPCLPNEPRKPPAKVDEPVKLTRFPGHIKKQSLGWITKYMPKNERDRYKTQPTKNDTGNQQISNTFVHHTCSKPWRKVAKVSCSSPIISGFTCKAPIISCASQGLHHVKSSEACVHFAGCPRLSIQSSQIHGFSKNKPQRTPKLVVVWPSQYGNIHFYKQNNWRILSEFKRHCLQLRFFTFPEFLVMQTISFVTYYTLSDPLRGPVSTLAKSWFHWGFVKCPTAQDRWSKIRVARLYAMKPIHSAPVSSTERHFPFLLLCWWNRWNWRLCSNRIFCREELCLQLDKVWGGDFGRIQFGASWHNF